MLKKIHLFFCAMGLHGWVYFPVDPSMAKDLGNCQSFWYCRWCETYTGK